MNEEQIQKIKDNLVSIAKSLGLVDINPRTHRNDAFCPVSRWIPIAGIVHTQIALMLCSDYVILSKGVEIVPMVEDKSPFTQIQYDRKLDKQICLNNTVLLEYDEIKLDKIELSLRKMLAKLSEAESKLDRESIKSSKSTLADML